MKIIISTATFAIIGLIFGHLIASSFISEYESERATKSNLRYPREQIMSCYGAGMSGGLIFGLVTGSIVAFASRRKASGTS